MSLLSGVSNLQLTSLDIMEPPSAPRRAGAGALGGVGDCSCRQLGKVEQQAPPHPHPSAAAGPFLSPSLLTQQRAMKSPGVTCFCHGPHRVARWGGRRKAFRG